MNQEIAYLHPVKTARALVLVYLCFSVPIVAMGLFVAFIRYGDLPGITVFTALILNALIGFGLLWLGCKAYNWVAARFGGIEVHVRELTPEDPLRNVALGGLRGAGVFLGRRRLHRLRRSPSSPVPNSCSAEFPGQRFHRAQLPLHLAGPHLGLFDIARGTHQGIARLGQHLAELAGTPVLTAPSTSHTSLERFSNASVRKPICRLLSKAVSVVGPATVTRKSRCNRSRQARAAQHLSVKPLSRQEQDREVGGGRRREVFLGNRLRLPTQRHLKFAAGHRHAVHVTVFLGIDKAFVLIGFGNFASIGSQTGPLDEVTARQADRELDPRPGIAHGLDILAVLVRRENLLQQRYQAAPHPTCHAISRWSARA